MTFFARQSLYIQKTVICYQLLRVKLSTTAYIKPGANGFFLLNIVLNKVFETDKTYTNYFE
jgi:hypothetical protein